MATEDINRKARRKYLKDEVIDKVKRESGYDALAKHYEKKREQEADEAAAEYDQLADEHDKAGALPADEKLAIVKAKQPKKGNLTPLIILAVLAAALAVIYWMG